MEIRDIKKRLKDLRVLFTTNGFYQWNSVGGYAIKSFAPLFEDNLMFLPSTFSKASKFDSKQHFWIYNQDDVDTCYRYGRDAFEYMLYNVLYDNERLLGYGGSKVRAVIYFDEDAFLDISCAELMLNELEKFLESGSPVAGIPDGGCCLVRSQNPIAINPFLSFWNIEVIEQAGITSEKVLEFAETAKQIKWSEFTSSIPREVLQEDNRRSVLARSLYAKTSPFRDFDERIEAIRQVEQHEDFYFYEITRETWKDMNVTEEAFESYYNLWWWLGINTKKPFWYLNSQDFIDEQKHFLATSLLSEVDKPGVYKRWLYHTWYARNYYCAFPQMQDNVDKKLPLIAKYHFDHTKLRTWKLLEIIGLKEKD